MELSQEETETLLGILKNRFQKNMHRHNDIDWEQIQEKLVAHPGKLWSLMEMEETGGEPDVVGKNEKSGDYIFFDCAPESPKGRRSNCYDQEALASRKMHPPKNSVWLENVTTSFSKRTYFNAQPIGLVFFAGKVSPVSYIGKIVDHRPIFRIE